MFVLTVVKQLLVSLHFRIPATSTAVPRDIGEYLTTGAGRVMIPQMHSEIDELRVSIERLRSMLESLIVRGLRACGRDELVQLESYAEDLDRSGAGHVSSILTELRQQIERNDRAAACTLLNAQTSVRLLERLLTLRVVGMSMQAATPSNDEPADDDSGA